MNETPEVEHERLQAKVSRLVEEVERLRIENARMRALIPLYWQDKAGPSGAYDASASVAPS